MECSPEIPKLANVKTGEGKGLPDKCVFFLVEFTLKLKQNYNKQFKNTIEKMYSQKSSQYHDNDNGSLND